MKKLLVVDDSPAWRGFHKKFLEEVFIELEIAEEDYKLDFAVSGQDGYDHIMQNNDVPYDLVISDLQMEEDYNPKYAGEWFVEQVKTFSNYFNTKIIICSGCYNIKHIAQELGVFYIPKRVAVNDINEYKDLIISLLK